MTVTELRTLYARYKKNISDVDQNLFLNWADEINRFAYRIMYGVDPERFIVPATYTIQTNDESYVLPDDFLTMQPIGCGLFPVENNVPQNNPLFRTGYGSQQYGYFINEGNIIITPVPTTSYTLILRYVPEIDILSQMTDSLVIPDEYIYYARNAIDCLYDMWAENPGAEGLADQRFIRTLDELARNLRKDTMTVGVQTYANYFYR